jgi:hypothetical protein
MIYRHALEAAVCDLRPGKRIVGYVDKDLGRGAEIADQLGATGPGAEHLEEKACVRTYRTKTTCRSDKN